MKKSKKFLAIFFPIIIVAVLALGIILPTSLADKNKNEEPSIVTYVDGVEGLEEDTGAREASAGYKGGAIFLEPNSTFTMKGGTISGHKNKYGGAIYVSNGATFTMTGGTIENNSADYGGAIYVEEGGHCYIEGGSISYNKATMAAPAIYTEAEADIKISESAEVLNNTYILEPGQISRNTIEVGKRGEGVQLHYLYYGSYPQTYAGDELNDELEQWYNESSPDAVNEYVNKANADATGNDNRIFTSYRYTDGQLYARGTSYRYTSGASYTYKDGATVKDTGEIVWFKVEPIKWVVLNYDEYLAGEPIEILSEEILTSDIQINKSIDDRNNWNASWVRTWLNSDFLNAAFSSEEKDAIVETHLKNNITNGHDKSPDNIEYWPVDNETDDKIYLLTFYELKISGRGNPLGGPDSYRYCSPTDYALSNFSHLENTYETNNRIGTAYWWLRTAGVDDFGVWYVQWHGSLGDCNLVTNAYQGLRPALRIVL